MTAFLTRPMWQILVVIGIILSPIKLAMINIGYHAQLSHIFLVAGILLAFADKKSGLKLASGRFDAGILIAILVLVLSTFQSEYIPLNVPVIHGALRNFPWIKSLSRVLFIVFLTGVAFFIRSFASQKQNFYFLLRVLIFSSAVYSLFGILEFINAYITEWKILFGIHLNTDVGNHFPRVSGFEWEPLFFGNYLLTITPVLIAMFVEKEMNFLNRKTLYVVGSLNSFVLLLTFSRSVWLGFIAAVFTIILLNYSGFAKRLTDFFQYVKNVKNNRFFLFGGLLVLFLILLVSIHLFFSYILPVFDPSSVKFWSTKLRIVTILSGLQAFMAHPIMGIGYDNFSFYSGNIFFVNLVDHAINYPEVNSFPVKLLIETGILGFSIISIIILKSLFKIIRIARSTDNSLLRTILHGYFASIIGIGVQLLFFSNILSVYLWVMLGMIMAAAQLAESSINNVNKY